MSLGKVGGRYPRQPVRNEARAYTRRHARTRDRRRRLHRLEPRRRAARPGPRGPVVDDLSSGKREQPRGRAGAGATLQRADIRDGAAMRELSRACARGRSSTSPRRSTCASRSPTRPTTRARTSGARSTCSRRRGRPASAAVVFASTGGAIYGETDVMPTPEENRGAADGAPTAEQALRGAVPRPVRAPLRPVDLALRFGNVYGPAPGPARRGRRHRDLLRAAARRRAGRGSSATASRPATTSTSATSSRRSPPPARATRPARSTWAPRRRPPCCGSPSCCSRMRAPTSPIDFQPGRLGELAALGPHAAGPASLLGWSAATPIDEGLRLTWEASADA